MCRIFSSRPYSHNGNNKFNFMATKINEGVNTMVLPKTVFARLYIALLIAARALTITIIKAKDFESVENDWALAKELSLSYIIKP